MAKRGLWFTEGGAATQLPRPFKVVAPVWPGAMLIQDATGKWWLRETGRWDADSETREISACYALSLFAIAYPDPDGTDAYPEPIRCESGEIG